MLKHTFRQAFAVFGVALSLIAHGCSHSYPALLIAMFTHHDGSRLTDHEISWIGSIITISKLCGTLLCPLLMYRFGRQKVHLMSTIPALASWVIFAFGKSIPVFISARLLQGLTIGLHGPMVTILIAEYTKPVNRGAFLATLSLSVSLGVIWVHSWGNILTLRMSALVCAVIPLITLVVVGLSPETPSWLVAKGRHQEARKVFKWLRGDGVTQNNEIEDLIGSVKNDVITPNVSDKFSNFKEDFENIRRKGFYRLVLISGCILANFEFGGVHFMPTYGNIILQSVLNKNNVKDVTWHLTLIDLLRSITSILALFLIKIVKRRTIVLTSGVLTVLSYVALSIFMYLRQIYSFQDGILEEVLPMFLMVLYISSFHLGLAPITFVIMGEIFPLSFRSFGTTVSMCMLSVNYVLVMKSAPHLYTQIGVEGAFLIYAGVLTVCLYVLYKLLPETKDKTLLDIEKSLISKMECDVEVEMRLMNKM